MSLSFYDSAADVLLMAIPNLIPNNFHTFVLGFNASDLDIPEEAIAIHHPGGAPAAISTVQGRCVKALSNFFDFFMSRCDERFSTWLVWNFLLL